MPYQLILSTDTLDQGRIKINDFFSSYATGIWSGSTGIDSVVSSSNYNIAVGNRSFVFGRQNSGITGNYSVISGGYKNYINAAFGFVGNGNLVRIKNVASSYCSIINGRTNYIGTVTTSKYSNILNGKTNSIRGGSYNTILNGSNHTIYGDRNVVNGGSININKASSNPSRIFANGNNISISGNSNVRDIMVFGLDHIINNTKNGLGGYSNYLLIGGGQNRNYKGGNSIMHGIKLSNETAAGSNTFRTDVFMFGRGAAGTAGTSFLRPTNSYSVIFGRNATKTVRIEFSSPSSVNLTGPGAFNTSGADYGEYFEWEDGNTNNESRVGYFVCLNKGKIKVSNTNKTIGIVSKTTAYIGDSNQDYWSGMHLIDEWGNLITEKYFEYVFDVEGNKKTLYFDENNICSENIPCPDQPNKIFVNGFDKNNGFFIKEIIEPIFNPNYDHSKQYIPRENRKEWDVVGLLGKLRVRTSEQIIGDYVDVDINNGMAKNGTTYHVLNKIKDYDGNYGIVLIFFK